jgi:transposase
MARDILTNEQWERLRAILPPQKPKTGHPAKDHRLVVNGILWILRTGAPWRDLPDEYGPWQTCSTRFYRWVKAGVWDRVLAELQQQEDGAGSLDWSLHHVDGTVVRAHQHAAGARKRGALHPEHIRMKHWAEAKADLAPRCTSEPRVEASPSPS